MTAALAARRRRDDRGLPLVEPVSSQAGRPFWSVMIPAFTNSALLERTLRSVLDQDPGPEAMQIEVVDDASTQGDIQAIVARIGKERVGYFRQPVNVGASRNFTTCVRRARGEWVHVLHSDDIALPGYYDSYGEVIKRCPDAVLVGGQTLLVDADERYLAVTPPLDTDGNYLRDAAFVLATRHPLQCVAAVVRRSAYEEGGGFDPALCHANDWEMWTRIAGMGPVAWVDRPVGLYRAHPGTDSQRLHRSTSYLDDCLAAVAIIVTGFSGDPRQPEVRLAGRRIISDYALDVGMDLTRQGHFRMAAKNAFRAMRLCPSVHSWSRAIDVIHAASTARLAARHLSRP